MADISKITLPSGSVYDLKDAIARKSIEELKSSLTNGGIRYLGVTETALTDGCDTTEIQIKNKEEDVSLKEGDIVIYGSDEFIFNGETWNKFGPAGTFKALAFKEEASGSFTPTGSVSKPEFTGTQSKISVTGVPEGTISITKGTGTANYTPEGTISQINFTGSQGSVSVSGTPTGTVTITKGEGEINYTPEGTIDKLKFTGTQGNVSVSGSPMGTVTITEGEDGTANYTPKGTISKPTGTVELNTTTITGIKDVGALPTCTMPTYNVVEETLSITAGNFSAGSLPTKAQEATVATTVKSVDILAPEFTGTGAELKATFAGSDSTFTGNFTPAGTVSQPTFTGTGIELKATFAGNKVTSTGNFTPTGNVSQPKFTGTGAELKATFSGSETTLETNYTPTGTVSQPTFTGNQGTVTVK